MKIIDKSNFFPTVCVVYTILSLSKIILEWLTLKEFGNLQLNFAEMFVISLIAIFVLSQHYRVQKLPFVIVLILQYAAMIGLIMLGTWIQGFFAVLHPNAYRDMFVSFTVPYIIGAAVYYINVFREVKNANRIIAEIKRKEANNCEKK